MKVLVLNPPGPYCRAGSRWPHALGPQDIGIDYNPFPFQLAYATSRLLSEGHEARIVDCVASRIDNSGLMDIVTDFNPDIVFMETSTPSFDADVATMRNLDRPCIAGGSHATARPQQHLDAGFAGVIRGEYDGVIGEAVTLEPRPWLATPDHATASGKPEATHAPLVTDLASVPYPPWEQMPMHRYGDSFCLGFAVTVLSSRGCPLQCCFCNLPHYHGRRNYRPRAAADVCDEIEALIERYQPHEIYFDDDTVTINRKHTLELSDEIARRDFGIPWSCMGNAPVDRDVLEAMARSGCRACKFGVESGDETVLKRIGKPLDLEAVKRTIRDCRDLGIRTHATYLLGLPGEDRDAARRTIDFALELGTNTLQFAIATPYPGTAFYKEAENNEWLTAQDGKLFDGAAHAAVSYPEYTADDILEMYDLAWRKWHMHMILRQPGTILHHFGNAYKRGGLRGLVNLGRYSGARLVTMAKSTRKT